jgi:valyl-tRNA synthetase
MKLLHPLCLSLPKKSGNSLVSEKRARALWLKQFLRPAEADQDIISRFEFASEVIIAMRNLRASNNIPQNSLLRCWLRKIMKKPQIQPSTMW